LTERCQRADPVLANRERHAAESADRCDIHHDSNHAEHALQEHVEHVDERRGARTQPGEGDREHNTEKKMMGSISPFANAPTMLFGTMLMRKSSIPCCCAAWV
jgi:hypothetical protein